MGGRGACSRPPVSIGVIKENLLYPSYVFSFSFNRVTCIKHAQRLFKSAKLAMTV
jgi:hypothetical protein